MAGRERMRLTDRAIARLRPREREFTVWDNHFVGLGVRVRPTGGRSYVLLEDTGGRSRRLSLGPVSLKTVAEVRRECHARKAEPEATGAPRRACSAVPGFRRGRVEGSPFRRIQAVHEKGRAIRARPPTPAGLRLEAARSHHPRRRSGDGSTASAGPPPATPITRSTFSRRSSTSRSPAVTSKPTRRGT